MNQRLIWNINDVGDPLLNGDDGIKVLGKKSNFIFEYVGDQDFASLYPSILRAYNLDPVSQVGKFFLIDKHIKENLITNFGYAGLFESSKNESGSQESTDDFDISRGTNDMGPTLIDSLESKNWAKIGSKFFDLPSAEDMIKEIQAMKKEN